MGLDRGHHLVGRAELTLGRPIGAADGGHGVGGIGAAAIGNAPDRQAPGDHTVERPVFGLIEIFGCFVFLSPPKRIDAQREAHQSGGAADFTGAARAAAAGFHALAGGVGLGDRDTEVEVTLIGALRPEVLLLVLAGLWHLRGRPTRRAIFIGAFSALYALVLYGLALNVGYLSRRHILPPAIPLLGYAAIGVPLVFATALFYASEIASDRATMGRLMFVALMIVLSLIMRPLAHPVTGVAASYYNEQESGWMSKLRWFWYGLAVGGPLLLAILSLIGYLYTSLILTTLLVDTIWLTLALIVVNLIVLRWIALSHRKLALKILLQQRAAERASRENEGDSESEGELPVAESKPLDLDEVDAQTRKLLRWGLIVVAVLAGWGIWSEVFPAFRLLEQVALWSQTSLVDGVETIVPVTLADILLAVLVAAGGTLQDVVSTQVFVTDLGEFAELNAVYAECFGDHKPARATVEVSSLPLGATVEIACTAMIGASRNDSYLV